MTSNLSAGQENIHQKFKYFGGKCLEFRQKCIGMLPQIFKEKIYVGKGFDSIFEYAAKLAGLSREQVSRALNVHAKFENLPVLKDLFESGEVSVNKLARVASIATADNEWQLAAYTRTMSQSAVETFVRDIRQNEKAIHIDDYQEGSQKPLFDQKSVRAHKTRGQRGYACEKKIENEYASPAKMIDLKLTAKNLEKLLELQEKGININEVIEIALQKREEEIEQDKAKAAHEYAEDTTKPASRHIPAGIKKIINAEQGTKCAVPECVKPSQVTHHGLPFAMTKTHDPDYLIRLCKAHHEIAHRINLQFYEIKKEAINSG